MSDPVENEAKLIAEEVIREQILLNGWRASAAQFEGAAAQMQLAALFVPDAMEDHSTGEQIQEEVGLLMDLAVAQQAMAEYYKRRLEGEG